MQKLLSYKGLVQHRGFKLIPFGEGQYYSEPFEFESKEAGIVSMFVILDSIDDDTLRLRNIEVVVPQLPISRAGKVFREFKSELFQNGQVAKPYFCDGKFYADFNDVNSNRDLVDYFVQPLIDSKQLRLVATLFGRVEVDLYYHESDKTLIKSCPELNQPCDQVLDNFMMNSQVVFDENRNAYEVINDFEKSDIEFIDVRYDGSISFSWYRSSFSNYKTVREYLERHATKAHEAVCYPSIDGVLMELKTEYETLHIYDELMYGEEMKSFSLGEYVVYKDSIATIRNEFEEGTFEIVPVGQMKIIGDVKPYELEKATALNGKGTEI